MTDQDELEECDPSDLTAEERQAQEDYEAQRAEEDWARWLMELEDLGILSGLTDPQKDAVATTVLSAERELGDTLVYVANRDKVFSRHPLWNAALRQTNLAAESAMKALRNLSHAVDNLRRTDRVFATTAKDLDRLCGAAVRAIEPIRLDTISLKRTLPGKSARRKLLETFRLSLQADFCSLGTSQREARYRTALVLNKYFGSDIKFNLEIPPDVTSWKRKDERRKARAKCVPKASAAKRGNHRS